RGVVRLHDRTAVQAAPVLDLRDEVWFEGDRGLLALALHPGFAPDGGETSWLYAAYVVAPLPGQDPPYPAHDAHGQPVYGFGRVARYRVVESGANVQALPDSREVLLGHPLPDGRVPDGIPSVHQSHTLGGLAFGADGTLLVSAGEGAHWDYHDSGGGDPAAFDDWTHPITGAVGPYAAALDSGSHRAQDLRSLAGKLLRIDPATGLGLPSNPFFDGDPASAASRVFALGLRNPFRIRREPGTGAADPDLGLPGTVWVADVGSLLFEELNRCLGGENFGWPCSEGPFANPAFTGVVFEPNPHGKPECGDAPAGALALPALAYERSDPSGMQPAIPHFDAAGQPQAGLTGSCVIGGLRYPGGGSYPAELDGRWFFADFAADWVATAELDAAGAFVALHDFASGVDQVVDFELDPLSGDVHLMQLGQGGTTGGIVHVRYGANLSPVADLQADPASGDPPLEVTFDASGSTDPDGDPLTYTFDFADGSAPWTSAEKVVRHTYAQAGSYPAQVTAADPGGLVSTDGVGVVVGAVAPTVAILSPALGAVVAVPGAVALAGTGSDPLGGPVTLTWSANLVHNSHVHPGWFTAEGGAAALDLAPHGGEQDVYYFEVVLTATTQGGTAASDRVWVYPAGQILDRTGVLRPIAQVLELAPPGPQGVAQGDVEVVRDAHFPPPGSADPSAQFATAHPAAPGGVDWVGFEYETPPGPHEVFVGLRFQEGLQSAEGGWFETLGVEVRDPVGLWHPVEDLTVEPAYPGAASPQAFEAFELRFSPVAGRAIRIVGAPGGTEGYVTVAELRVLALTPDALAHDSTDWTADGAIVARLLEQTPPVSQGPGNKDLATVRNGTWPPEGSPSLFAQVDTYHPAKLDFLDDWIGYAFDDLRVFDRVDFQEGVHRVSGGWFQTLRVETRLGPGAPWLPVTNQAEDPPYRSVGLGTPSYETYRVTFEPVVAREIRVVGTPGGTGQYVSVGELRVRGPWFDAEQCGVAAYGDLPDNPLALVGSAP
ncbi:MAG TPA: PKD domain-containing protein, partial [Planctomycetota bacterium]|nr:PKD domain-containing protein [Planctomycetota bacterium]